MPDRGEPLKAVGELFDDVRSGLLESSDLREGKASLAEAYVCGNYALHLHLRIGVRGEASTHDLCIVYEIDSGVDPQFRDLVVADEVDGRLLVGDLCGDDIERAVLVVPVKLVENGERMVRSVVRLKLLDSCPLRIGDARERGAPGSLGIAAPNVANEVRLAPVDRKAVVSAGGLFIGQDELPDEMVERGSGVVEGVAEDRAQRERVLDGFDIADVPAFLRVVVEAEAIGLSVEEGGPFALKGIKCSCALASLARGPASDG